MATAMTPLSVLTSAVAGFGVLDLSSYYTLVIGLIVISGLVWMVFRFIVKAGRSFR